jgi:hypothetical protein
MGNGSRVRTTVNANSSKTIMTGSNSAISKILATNGKIGAKQEYSIAGIFFKPGCEKSQHTKKGL